MGSRKHRLVAWVAAGILVLCLTFAGMIIRFGNFQGPDNVASTAARITSTAPTTRQAQPLGQVMPPANGFPESGAEQGD
jgi:hypothetical protein